MIKRSNRSNRIKKVEQTVPKRRVLQEVKKRKVKIQGAVKEVSVIKEHQEIIDKWNNYGFKKFYIRDTKTFSTTIQKLRKLKNGRLFNGEVKFVEYKRKYPHEEILKVIDNLNLAIEDIGTFGLEPKDYNRLIDMTLGEFIFNPWSPYKSEFIKFLDERLFLLCIYYYKSC